MTLKEFAAKLADYPARYQSIEVVIGDGDMMGETFMRAEPHDITTELVAGMGRVPCVVIGLHVKSPSGPRRRIKQPGSREMLRAARMQQA